MDRERERAREVIEADNGEVCRLASEWPDKDM